MAQLCTISTRNHYCTTHLATGPLLLLIPVENIHHILHLHHTPNLRGDENVMNEVLHVKAFGVEDPHVIHAHYVFGEENQLLDENFVQQREVHVQSAVVVVVEDQPVESHHICCDGPSDRQCRLDLLTSNFIARIAAHIFIFLMYCICYIRTELRQQRIRMIA